MGKDTQVCCACQVLWKWGRVTKLDSEISQINFSEVATLIEKIWQNKLD